MAVQKLQTRIGDIFLIRPDDDPAEVFVRAEVGEIKNLADPAHYLRNAFAANRFGLDTNGAVLSLGGEEDWKIYLTLRANAEGFDIPENQEDVLESFASALLHWREMLELEPTVERENNEGAEG